MSAETVTRPNGKTYRATKPPTVEEFTNYDGLTGIVVLRTHDYDAARDLAAASLEALDLDPATGNRTWWRLVPWDNTGHCDRSWIEDDVRGAPCVIWEPEW